MRTCMFYMCTLNAYLQRVEASLQVRPTPAFLSSRGVELTPPVHELLFLLVMYWKNTCLYTLSKDFKRFFHSNICCFFFFIPHDQTRHTQNICIRFKSLLSLPSFTPEPLNHWSNVAPQPDSSSDLWPLKYMKRTPPLCPAQKQPGASHVFSSDRIATFVWPSHVSTRRNYLWWRRGTGVTAYRHSEGMETGSRRMEDKTNTGTKNTSWLKMFARIRRTNVFLFDPF